MPKSTLIASSFYHQSPVIAYLIPQRNQGVFKIQCKNEDDYNKLRTFKLKITDGKTRKITEIPPEKPNRHLPKGNPNFENGTMNTTQGACENGMEETNKEIDKVNLDKLSEKHGLVIIKDFFLFLSFILLPQLRHHPKIQ